MLANIPHFLETMDKIRRVPSSLFKASFIASLAAIPRARALLWLEELHTGSSVARAFHRQHGDAAGEARDEWPDGFATK